MTPGVSSRVASLDLIRGVAVLGILAMNIGGFAGPPGAVGNPNIPAPASFADQLGFAIKFLFFEGKMRALFTMLFGASMVLFIERAEATGRFGEMLQLRRLGWLMLFGLAHYYLIWWGDILFLYGLVGLIALLMRDMATGTLIRVALAIFVLWHAIGAAMDLPNVLSEQAVLNGTASPAETASHAAYVKAVDLYAHDHIETKLGGFAQLAADRLGEWTFRPLEGALLSVGETLPLMLLGMALYRTGFFKGCWTRRRMWMWAGGGIVAGLIPTGLVLAWVWREGFPVRTMDSVLLYWMAVPHLLMALGYSALLVLAAPRLARTLAGNRIEAAGRMAFSNYIGTSIAMTAIFYGWGLGAIGRVGHAWQWAFVVAGWLAMLAWSGLWLRHFRRGPLEWLWRSLVEKQILANRR